MRLAFVLVLAGCGAATPLAPAEPAPDVDGDAIAGELDRCPDEAEDEDGFRDEDGCRDLDDDEDGIADASDRCRCVAEDPDGFEDEDGCPDEDDDGDRIHDACDECPREPETWNTLRDDDGCPDFAAIRVSEERIRITPHPHFDRGSAAIRDADVRMLREIADALAASPEIERLAIEGHADTRERGGAALSEQRAIAVRDWLVAHGVDATRLEASGLGSTSPLASNDAATGRALNRRVDFRILAVAEPEPEPEPLPRPDPRETIAPGPRGYYPTRHCPDGAPPALPDVCAAATAGSEDAVPRE